MLTPDQDATAEILHLASHEGLVHEGAGHSGMAALIDLVARKPTRNLR